MTPEYPEHEKLEAIRGQRDTVQRFLDWLMFEQGYDLSVPHEHTDDCRCRHDWHTGGLHKPAYGGDDRECPACGASRRDLLDFPTIAGFVCGYSEGQAQRLNLHARDIVADYFDIDLDKIQREKVKMLDFVRELNKGES